MRNVARPCTAAAVQILVTRSLIVLPPTLLCSSHQFHVLSDELRAFCRGKQGSESIPCKRGEAREAELAPRLLRPHLRAQARRVRHRDRQGVAAAVEHERAQLGAVAHSGAASRRRATNDHVLDPQGGPHEGGIVKGL